MRGIATLDRKLMRDLWRIKGQALAIALVIGAGVAVFVVMLDLTNRPPAASYRSPRTAAPDYVMYI